jgi:hypothetical protein
VQNLRLPAHAAGADGIAHAECEASDVQTADPPNSVAVARKPSRISWPLLAQARSDRLERGVTVAGDIVVRVVRARSARRQELQAVAAHASSWAARIEPGSLLLRTTVPHGESNGPTQ